MLARFQSLLVDLLIGTILTVLERPSVQATLSDMAERECLALITALVAKQDAAIATEPSNGLVNWAYVCATG